MPSKLWRCPYLSQQNANNVADDDGKKHLNGIFITKPQLIDVYFAGKFPIRCKCLNQMLHDFTFNFILLSRCGMRNANVNAK